jgi:hypothetical protein
MADVRIRRVEFDGSQRSHTPFPVEVYINNNELTAPFWGAAYCEDNGPGHKVDVWLRVQKPDGTEVDRIEKTGLCVPVNSVDHWGGANQVAEFQVELPPGEYILTATVDVRKVSGIDASEPQTVTVEEGTGGLGGGDDGGDNGGSDYTLPWMPGGGGGGGGGGFDVLEDVDAAVTLLLVTAFLYSAGQLFDIDLGGS